MLKFQPMKVSELGQFGLIDLLAKMIEEARDDQAEAWKQLIKGVGDDCAVWQGNPAHQLAKVDCQVQGVHFNLDIISWEDLGWKSLAVNLSDIAAMGGLPRYALVSLGLPPDTEVEDAVSLYRGILKLAKQSGSAVVGGNTSSSSVIFVDVCVIGITANPESRYLTRSAARPGDLIAVTGWLGSAAAGLEMLTRKLEFDPALMRYLKQAFAQPQPRLKEGLLLVEKGVRSGMDISDGLISDLDHICQSSHVGALIQVEKLPIWPEVKTAFGPRARQMALSGGEDYQLLFTAPAAVVENVSRSSTCPISVIGEITADKACQIVLIDEKGRRLKPRNSGWDHFKSRAAES